MILKRRPAAITGIVFFLIMRTLFAIFWLVAGVNKINSGWVTSDVLKEVFLQRLTELPPDSFAVFYLSSFAIPLHTLIAWTVTLGELYSAVGLLIGLTTRWSAGVSLFILINFAIGGYYDASLIPFFVLVALFIYYPSGQWLGFDKPLHAKYPKSIWFR